MNETKMKILETQLEILDIQIKILDRLEAMANQRALNRLAERGVNQNVSILPRTGATG